MCFVILQAVYGMRLWTIPLKSHSGGGEVTYTCDERTTDGEVLLVWNLASLREEVFLDGEVHLYFLVEYLFTLLLNAVGTCGLLVYTFSSCSPNGSS